MTFLWPELLWLLVLVPVIVGVYLLLLRRKHRLAVRYASPAGSSQFLIPGAGAPEAEIPKKY